MLSPAHALFAASRRAFTTTRILQRPFPWFFSNIWRMDDNPAKRQKTGAARIGTHSGHFHADEALAVYMLRLMPDYANAQLTRSRDPVVLEGCDIIVDVQGVYDGTKHFDHHQRSFNETFSPNHKTKLSSAGLIYKHFAPQIIASHLDLATDHPSVDLLYWKLYKEFVEALDANDNGVSAYPEDVRPAFSTGGVSLPSLVGAFNPDWNDPVDQAGEDGRFEMASKFIGDIFVRKLKYYAQAWLPARRVVEAALEKRFEHDSHGRILILEQGCPWRDHLFTIEEEKGIIERDKLPLYVLYSEGAGKPNWRVHCVPVNDSSFRNRKGLPEAWRALRDDQLSRISGIPGCVFVHASGFIGGNTTYEGALAMAKKALEI